MTKEELITFLINENVFYACVKLESALSLMTDGKEKEAVQLAYIQLQELYNILTNKEYVDED